MRFLCYLHKKHPSHGKYIFLKGSQKERTCWIAQEKSPSWCTWCRRSQGEEGKTWEEEEVWHRGSLNTHGKKRRVEISYQTADEVIETVKVQHETKG